MLRSTISFPRTCFSRSATSLVPLGVLDVDVEAPRCLDSAGYLSHLGIELHLKAFLLRHTGNFRDDHSLTNLLRTLEANGVHLALSEEQFATVEQLDQFYHLRYPQTAGSPSVGGLDWLAIHSLASALGDQLPEDLQRDVLNLDRTRKFGRVLMKKEKDGLPFEGHVIVVDTPEKEK